MEYDIFINQNRTELASCWDDWKEQHTSTHKNDKKKTIQNVQLRSSYSQQPKKMEKYFARSPYDQKHIYKFVLLCLALVMHNSRIKWNRPRTKLWATRDRTRNQFIDNHIPIF